MLAKHTHRIEMQQARHREHSRKLNPRQNPVKPIYRLSLRNDEVYTLPINSIHTGIIESSER
jgi:hypothetical protein